MILSQMQFEFAVIAITHELKGVDWSTFGANPASSDEKVLDY